MAAGFPSSTLVAIEFTAGVWTDVSSSVRGDSIEINVGDDTGAEIVPGTLALTFDNATGTFTPDNPTGTYYPNLVEGKRIRVQTVKSATTYTRFVGRITSISPDYPSDPAQSLTQVSAVDVLGDLARIALPSVQEAYARLNDSGQAAFYPLTDINEHAGMVDVLGNAARLRVWNQSASSGSIEARSDTSLFETRPYVALTAGKGLYSTTPFPEPVGGGTGEFMRIVLLVKVTSSSYGEVLRVSTSRCDKATDYNVVKWTSSGFVVECVVGGAVTGTSSASAADDGWHHLNFNVSDLSVDGAATVGTTSYSGQNRHISLGGDIDMSVGDLLVVNDTTIVAGYVAGNVTLDTRTLVQSATDLGTVTRSTGLGATYTWTTTPEPAGASLLTEDRTALEVLADLANSQSGIAYAVPSTSATQTVQLVASPDARPSAVALTLDAEADLDGGPTATRDIDGTTATATASSSVGTVTVTDSSVAAVGAASVDVSTALSDDNDLAGVASDRIARGRDKRLRVSELTFDLATAANDLYAAFYALTLGERVRLSGLPSAYFGVTYLDGYVTGWTERPGITGYGVTLYLSPADAPPEAVLDDSTYDRVPFGTGVCTLTSNITSGATSISLTFTGSALLSTDAGDYPLDLDLNGERVTIGSAPAGGSSPRTVTVTRGVAPTVARAHTAGEPIDVWLGASIAL